MDVMCWIENNASTTKGMASKTLEHEANLRVLLNINLYIFVGDFIISSFLEK